MILGNAVLNFVFFIIHCKLIRFKTSLIRRNNEHFELVITIRSQFCVHLFIIHCKLIRFKTSFIIVAMIELET